MKGKMTVSRQKPLTRDSNLELYRIIIMLLIVAAHYVNNSGLMGIGGPIRSDPLSWRSLFLVSFAAFGKAGINCFVLITGYFMCQSRITAKKFMRLLGEVMFYKIVIGAVFLLTHYSGYSLTAFLKALIPVTALNQGFTGCFLVFFLFIPFLNILIQNLTERQHFLLLLLCGFVYVFFGTLPFFSVTMNYVSWFMVLYIIASYLRLYPKSWFERTALWGWLTATFVFLSVLSVIFCAWLGTKLGKDLVYFFVTDSNTFLAVMTGICSFMLFKNLKVKPNRFINTVASTTFGVLCIHANSDTMRRWLWGDVLQNVKMYGSKWMVLHAICSVLGVFAVCSILDCFRIRLIEPPFLRLWDIFEAKVCTPFLQAHFKSDTKEEKV